MESIFRIGLWKSTGKGNRCVGEKHNYISTAKEPSACITAIWLPLFSALFQQIKATPNGAALNINMQLFLCL